MIEKLNDEVLEKVSGGMTANLRAAYACINGDYGNGEARFEALRRAGFDPKVVQGLVNDLLKPATITTPSRTWSTTCCCAECGRRQG